MATNQARTILGPLTTTATLPASCSLPVQQCLTCGQAWRAQTCFASPDVSSTNFGVQDNTDCWPTTSSFAAKPTVPLLGWGFYSPGLVCPSGLHSACTATAGGSSDWPVQFGMLSGETAVGCCPSGFTCANNYVQTCLSTAIRTTVDVVACESGSMGAVTEITVPQTLTSTVSGSASLFLQSTYVLYAPLIQINWQASDRPSSISSIIPTSTSPSQQTSSANSSQSSSGLSTGAKAGLGVGISAIILLFLAFGLFIYRKRKNAYTRPGNSIDNVPPGYTNSQMGFELGDKKAEPYTEYPRSELPSQQAPIAELVSPLDENRKQKPPAQIHEMSA